ncbi:MAG: T9SS type A sorting domain-containing protein [Bacteroidota bacterium]|nr:T9SS type A sorting domain-containing protein [Bacteroidota bacterium]
MKLDIGQFKMKISKVAAVVLLMTMTTFTYGKTASPFEVQTVFFNSFDIKVSATTIEMTWVVTEYNNKSFVIQHSLNGADWEDVAFIPSQNSPESLVEYSFKLSNATSGRHYYRLKYTDIDLKKIGFSPVKNLLVAEEKQDISVWPNPASNVVNISNNSKGINQYTTGSVFDLSGRKMIAIKLEQGNNTISVANLPAGTYLLYLENSNGNPFNQKIIKQ